MKRLAMLGVLVLLVSSIAFVKAEEITGTEQAPEIKILPYHDWNYPQTLLFKGSAVNRDYDAYPAVFLMLNFKGVIYPGIKAENPFENTRFYLIIDDEIHKLKLENFKVKPDQGVLILSFSEGEKTLFAAVRYGRYNNDMVMAGIYDKKYLINMNLARNEPVYRIMDFLAENKNSLKIAGLEATSSEGLW